MKPDTIVALASGAGRAGVAVIRVSGPMAGATLRALRSSGLPAPRLATFSAFRDANSGDLLDEGLALWFPAPRSFTGEDVAELHVHGGPAVIEAIVGACLARAGVRPAEPGEFTRRAFENGKLDLAQAEGLADLVDAETEGQRRQALRQSRGALSEVYEAWRARLIEAAALIEAEIDFPDEDLPEALARRAGPILEALGADMARHLDDSHRGERVRDGYRIAIIGPPNAGKSSLLNALARREAAIVSELPGTTRDVVEVRLVLGGFPVWIADTAGLREAADAVEAEGVRRALARAEEADLILFARDPASRDPSFFELLAGNRAPDIWVHTKADLREPPPRAGIASLLQQFDAAQAGLGSASPLEISVATGQGLSELREKLAGMVVEALGREEAPMLTRARHRRLVEAARAALEQARAALSKGPELAAEDVRVAATAIGRLTGRIDVEGLLDEIFSSFCIGK
ncbi:MAG: tRNA uridine-5-carboxymethylaminomethyl(34) synthesis GTPase MnmE [Terricaulis sp.]